VLNNQPNSNTTEMKQRTRNLKSSQNCSYRTQPICHCSGDFWRIWTVQLKSHKVWTCWQNFSLIQQWTKRRLRPEVFERNFLSLLFSLSVFSADGCLSVRKKTLKVNIGLGLHIGSEPNPTNLPLTTMWRWLTNRQSHNKFQTCLLVAS